MDKERFEWLYNETMLKHYMVDNLNNNQLGYESIVNLLNQQHQKNLELEEQSIRDNQIYNEQLAEKDKIYVESLIKLEKESEEQLEKQATIHYRHLKEKDQDKIEFAVKQLEQVKSELVNKVSPVKLSYTDYVQEVFNKINNQIKQLKEMK